MDWCAGSDRLVSAQVKVFDAEPLTELLNGQTVAPMWSLVGTWLLGGGGGGGHASRPSRPEVCGFKGHWWSLSNL